MVPYTPRRSPMPLYATYAPLAPLILHSLPAPIHPDTPCYPLNLLMTPNTPTPLRRPQCPLMLPISLLTLSTYTPCQPPKHTWHPLMPLMAPNTLTPPRRPQYPLMPPIPLLVVNCHHFATDHLHTVKMLIFYHHFQLSPLCNWPSSQVHPVYKIQSLGVKNTSWVLWSSANFCSISKNIHYKDPVTSQHWETNKVVWTWKDDWPSWRTSTYERPFTWEGNYLVTIASCNTLRPVLSNLRVFLQEWGSTPNLEAIHPLALPILWNTGHPYPIKLIKIILYNNILVFEKQYHLMKTIKLKTAWQKN